MCSAKLIDFCYRGSVDSKQNRSKKTKHSQGHVPKCPSEADPLRKRNFCHKYHQPRWESVRTIMLESLLREGKIPPLNSASAMESWKTLKPHRKNRKAYSIPVRSQWHFQTDKPWGEAWILLPPKRAIELLFQMMTYGGNPKWLTHFFFIDLLQLHGCQRRFERLFTHEHRRTVPSCLSLHTQ